MRFIEALSIAIKALLTNKLRSFFTMLGILIGIASVLAMIAIGDGAKQLIIQDIEKIGGLNVFTLYRPPYKWVRNRLVPNRSREHFNYADALAIEAECPSVKVVAPRIPASTRVLMQTTNGSNLRASYHGVNETYTEAMHWTLRDGRFISEEDVEDAQKNVVLGANVAKELFGDTSPIGKEIKIGRKRHTRQTERFIVIGILMPRGRSFRFGGSFDDQVFIPITTVQQRFTGNKRIPHIVVHAYAVEAVSKAIEEVKAVIRKRHRKEDDFFGIFDPRIGMAKLSKISTVLKIALGSIAGFALFVSGIGIMNICLVSVGEKTREIGLRKSVGAKRLHIFWQFLTESICLCLCGGVLGIAGGWLAAHGMASVAVRILPIVPEWPVVLSVPWIAISVLFSIFMGIIFGIYPAVQASRMSPMDALRTDI